jgi:N-acetylglucosamine-6-phosphate deacetylase
MEAILQNCKHNHIRTGCTSFLCSTLKHQETQSHSHRLYAIQSISAKSETPRLQTVSAD